MNDGKKTSRSANPKHKSNFLSRITFFYTLELFRKGCTKDLDENDLYEVSSNYKSKLLGDELEDEWERQRKVDNKHSVMVMLWRCYGWAYLKLGLVQLIYKTIIIIVQPTVLGNLVLYFVAGQKEITRLEAYANASILILVNLLSRIYTHNYSLYVTGLAVKARTGFCSLIYRKTLKLNSIALNGVSGGMIVTMLTKDVNSFERFLQYANEVWVGVVQTVIASCIIYRRLGTAALIGPAFFLAIVPIQVYLGYVARKLRKGMGKRTDERLQITHETLTWIKQIKMYVWESYFTDKITEARKTELTSLLRIFYLKFISLQIGTLNSSIAFFLLIMTASWTGQQLTAEKVYFIITCFTILSHTMSVIFPHGIFHTAEFLASCKRIGFVLKTEENQSAKSELSSKSPEITFENAAVSVDKTTILKNIDLKIGTGLTVLTGPVGSGKTSLLKTILKDGFDVTHGDMRISGRISYAQQEPWLFSSSIRENIVFHQGFDADRYSQVLKFCDLIPDLKRLPNGDLTNVEDRALNLSKGQQVRINLARAVYRKADIYLLDDSLSSLDPEVSDRIFRNCIVHFLRHKLVILVAEKYSHFGHFYDNIIVIENGLVKLTSRIHEKDSPIDEKIFNNDDYGIVNTETESVLNIEKTNSSEEKFLNEEYRLTAKSKKSKKKINRLDTGVYKRYTKFGGGTYTALFVFTIFAMAQFVISYTDILVSKWVNLEQHINMTWANVTQTESLEQERVLNIYSVMITLRIMFTLTRAFALFSITRTASLNLHKYMLDRTVNAKLNFFDDHLIGNIINYFSKDLHTVDENIPSDIYNSFGTLLTTLGVILLIVIVNPWFVILASMLFVIMTRLRKYYLLTGCNLKRLESSTKAPVLAYLNSSLEGLSTIKAHSAEEIWRQQFDQHQDLHTSASLSCQYGMRAFAFWLDMCSTLFISIIVASILFLSSATQPGNIGLVLTQALQLTGTLQNGIRQWAEMENSMISVERILNFTKTNQESDGGVILPNWPSRGEISYENVHLKHRNNNILTGINFNLVSGEKVGIVGRTGAGKSSVISTLFRLYEVDGKITIDDTDIKPISLKFLRSQISIIPQDPMVFSGNLRENIDPLKQHTDENIWKAIDKANLKPAISNLAIPMEKCNLSLGQKQLLSLVRALLRNNKIIVLDEATSNVDAVTDSIVQQVIAEKFTKCTVLTIAHKINTVLNSDKILVLDKGEIVEWDRPEVLLKNHQSRFYRMTCR